MRFFFIGIIIIFITEIVFIAYICYRIFCKKSLTHTREEYWASVKDPEHAYPYPAAWFLELVLGLIPISIFMGYAFIIVIYEIYHENVRYRFNTVYIDEGDDVILELDMDTYGLDKDDWIEGYYYPHLKIGWVEKNHGAIDADTLEEMKGEEE